MSAFVKAVPAFTAPRSRLANFAKAGERTNPCMTESCSSLKLAAITDGAMASTTAFCML